MCQISILTSIYNGERFLGETIESIQKQTFTDYEWLIFDNCSTDATVSIIESYAVKDPRIRLFKNEKNVGQVPNLNRGISLARGKYIARSDADDISYPERLQKQYDYMETHSDTVLIGTGMDQWRNGERISTPAVSLFQNDAECRFGSLFFCVLPNSSFFIRKEALEKGNIRYRDYDYAEDWALIVDLLGQGKVSKIIEPLIMYRIYGEQVTQRLSAELRISETEEIMNRYLDTLPIKDKKILQLAIRGEMTQKTEYQAFQEELLSCAVYFGLGKDRRDASQFTCVQRAYRTVMSWQRGNARLFFAYRNSPLRGKESLFSVSGLVFLKKCIRHYGKKRQYGGVD